MSNIKKLIYELRKCEPEQEWIEFKHNNYDPEMIGQDICALANGAALKEKDYAYMIWGIDNETQNVIGTDYDLKSLKKGNQELENWLRCLLSGNADFSYERANIEGKDVGVLTIRKAINRPVAFKKEEYIRVGSYTKKLKDYPALQDKLWEKIKNSNFETMYAMNNLKLQEALHYLDYTQYFDFLKIPVPLDGKSVAHYLLEDGLLARQDDGLYSITNLGAILFAKQLNDFEKLFRKSVRIIQYDGVNRINMLKEEVFDRGYALDFENMIKYIEALIPTEEIIGRAIREKKSAYPILAIREIIANALIHQDFYLKGTGTVVEVFSNRIEITNPGIPLVEILRIVDNPPKSRNEKLASLMRRLGMCEELGTGWDKIIISCEYFLLPAPRIDLYNENTKVTLFADVKYTSLTQEERILACYWHSCIKYVQGEFLTNSSLRNRFGLEDSAAGSISRLIKEAVAKGKIKPVDPDTAPRYMKYIPYWA